MREAVARIEQEIANLRSIITELRPAALDELGLRAALDSLLDRHQEQTGTPIERELAMAALARGQDRLEGAVETAVYRLVQEALTNVAKHAEARAISVSVRESGGEITIEVRDDGKGFDTASRVQGFGLAGMRERVDLADGTLDIQSAPGATVLTACLPASRRERNGAAEFSGADQAAS
jgi:signal transduction histidine kinase